MILRSARPTPATVQKLIPIAFRARISLIPTHFSPSSKGRMLHSAKPHPVPKETEEREAEANTAQPSSKSTNKLIFAPTGGSTSTTGHAIQYHSGTLSLSDLSHSPLTQFHTWFLSAQTSSVYQPETVTLSTCSLPSGRISSRVVFLKELDSHGFVIYSNWATSQKAADVATNPRAALTFWWREVERQVRVEGRTERLSDEESQVYFDTRARGSRIGAWASAQSSVLRGREELEGRVSEVERRFKGVDRIPVPGFWGGLRVVPDRVEFWQGRESRLHDRFRYSRIEGEGEGEKGWSVERLSP
ncbi:hypothetical protein B0J11DRAFT_523272 [Dendryphion nanum]|uniref:pyridoxal 5'-phosphate synthase n=1 Tax=Dendryphion nanum TaxID=256645 RepID=A0A9P9IS79_9PLEO|nr:hypothetical protein B0J11DRAFT_523272 [Dendryphion nanum]